MSVRRLRLEAGNVAAEFALLLPVLIVILCGAVDFTRAFLAFVTISSTAHEAALYAARYPGADAPAAALRTVVAGESGGFATIVEGSTGNTTMSGPILEGLDEQVARVVLTYQFQPLVPIPLAGPIPISAMAAAPTGGDGAIPTSTPGAAPTSTSVPIPTSTPAPTATIALCTVPDFVGASVSLNGNTARQLWTNARFDSSNFTKHENNGTARSQSLTAGSQQPCSTAAIVVHNHA